MSRLTDFLPRVMNGTNPWTALTTSAPQASPSNSMSSTAYAPYGGTLNPSQGVAIQGSRDPAGRVLGESTGGGVAPAPDLNPYKNDVQSRIGQLQSMYQQLYGTVDQNVADQRNTFDQGYTTQQTQLNNDYQNSMGQIGQVMAGRGLADSSYLGDAQGQATQAYSSNLDSLNQQRDQAYGSLGQFATTQKASLGAGQSQLGKIDLSQYTDPAQLMSLRDQLDQQLASLNQTSAGLGTNASYQSALQAATPAATQQGSAQLQAQLQKLKASGASPLVTNQIAQGLIKSAGKQNDPLITSFWQQLQSS